MLLAAQQALGLTPMAIEIGAAGGTLNTSIGAVISSDIRFDNGLDLVFNAHHIPLTDDSLDVIFMKDALHHIPDVELFFNEALRVLRSGGGIICVDPYWRGIAKCIYRWFHPEPFNEKQLDWKFQSGVPTDSNQAMLYILLRRDRVIFETRFPEFEIMEFGSLVGPSYIASGGVTAPRFVPTPVLMALRNIENRTNLWRKFFALEYLVVFRKRPN